MAKVVLKDLTKKFGNVFAVRHANLEIQDGEFMVLVGPSGCGKTTALRCVAGLEEASEGEIWIGERLVNDVSPKDRDIAMVFQNYALYPHMNVYENMAFGLRLRMPPTAPLSWLLQRPAHKAKNAEIDRRVKQAAEMLDLQPLLHRRPKELSGGQRQRVALGRAIVREPKVFLMDEPLSNLDAKLRVQTRAELIRLHRRLGITTIYVTHDQVEAMTMGDRIAVMEGGVIQQVDTPLNLYNHPVNMFVAGFIGSPEMNMLEATLKKLDGNYFVDTGSFQVKIPEGRAKNLEAYEGKSVMFGIRPEDIYDPDLAPFSNRDGNQVTVTVDVIEPMGSSLLVYLTAGKHPLIASCDANTKLKETETWQAVFDMQKAHLFDRDTTKAIF